MLFAPHPDDEVRGCGILLQRAQRAGAAIRVVYATDGDNNPWPQRFIERKWRLNAADRKRWGQLRRREALAALSVLGVGPSAVRFLGLPDQGLTDILTAGCRLTIESIVEILRDWPPTHLFIPSAFDTHPDHNALAAILRFVLAELLPDERPMLVSSYAVHGRSRAFFDRAESIQQSRSETATKLLAIKCHQTQLRLSKRRFFAYSGRPERFVPLLSDGQIIPDGAIRSFSRAKSLLRIELQLTFRLFSAMPRLLIFGYDTTHKPRCIAIRFAARSANVDMHDVSNGLDTGTAKYRGNAYSGTLTVPIDIFSGNHSLFAKVERRGLHFFDEAGWLEIPPPVDSPPELLRQRKTICYASKPYSV